MSVDPDDGWPEDLEPSARAEDFFGESGFVPARLGQYLSSEASVRLGPDGQLYRYADGVYRRDGESWARMRVRELLGERFRRRQLDEVLTWLRADLSSVPAHPDSAVINVENGLLNWRTGELAEHSPEVVSTIRIPVVWRSAATCPRIDEFLRQVLPEDAIDFVLEVIGYALYPANPFQKAVLLLGPGGNGKGTLLHIVRALCGLDNVSARTLHALAEDRFAASELFGRLANICGDLDARTVERSDTFKMVTGGDPVTAERKYGHAFTFVPFALLLFSANQAPLTSDQTQAYFDRWLVVPMTRRFRDTVGEDPALARKLTAAGELEGLLQLAVQALRRLMTRGRFDVPASIREAGDRLRSELDSVVAFAAEACDVDLTDWTSRADLYAAYSSWCQVNGRRPLSSRMVYSKILELFPTAAERIRVGSRGFVGLALHGAAGAEGAGSLFSPPRAREKEGEIPAPYAPSAPSANGHARPVRIVRQGHEYQLVDSAGAPCQVGLYVSQELAAAEAARRGWAVES